MLGNIEEIIKNRIQIPEEFFQDEVREGFFVERKMKCAWAAQMEVLMEIDRICKRNGIMYFVDCGTLLGAVRHKGFIPWDDDIDISMKRDDYRKFISVLQRELPEGWLFLDLKNDKNRLFGRVTNGDLYDSRAEHMLRFHGCPYVVGIDIFPIDYLAVSPEEDEVWFLVLKYIYRLALVMEVVEEISEDAERDIRKAEEMCNVKIDRNGNIHDQLMRLVEQMAQIYQKDEAQEMERVVWDLGQEWRYKYKKEWYEKSIEMPFENIMVPVPVGYEYILPRLYGNDYMTPKQDIAGHDYPFYKQQDIELEKMRKEKAGNRAQESEQ